jgi:hypothetical protein
MDPAPRIPGNRFSSRDAIARNGSRDKVGTVLEGAGGRVFVVVDWMVSWTEGCGLWCGCTSAEPSGGPDEGRLFRIGLVVEQGCELLLME